MGQIEVDQEPINDDSDFKNPENDSDQDNENENSKLVQSAANSDYDDYVQNKHLKDPSLSDYIQVPKSKNNGISMEAVISDSDALLIAKEINRMQIVQGQGQEHGGYAKVDQDDEYASDAEQEQDVVEAIMMLNKAKMRE